jgi:hypothetical protein
MKIWSPDEELPNFLGFDIESELIDRQCPWHGWPKVTVVAVSDGKDWHRLFGPELLPEFLIQVRDLGVNLVAHNAMFDWLAVDGTLTDVPSWAKWSEILNDGQLECTMLLDQLLRLATADLPKVRLMGAEAVPARSLKDLCKMRLGVELKKGEISTSFAQVKSVRDLTYEQVEYALQDAIYVKQLWDSLAAEARRLEAGAHQQLYPKHVRGEFGLLTSRVQLKAAVALDLIRRNGMCIDQKLLGDKERIAREVQAGAAQNLRQYGVLEPVLKLKNPPPNAVFMDVEVRGKMKRKWIERWKVNESLLGNLLLGAVRSHNFGDREFVPPTTETGEISLSKDTWQGFRRVPIVRDFLNYKRQQKTLTAFIAKYQGQGRVHPKFRTIIRSGRTSCYDPNLQQVPKRSGNLRDLFVPSPTSKFTVIDYKQIELSAVAQICVHRLGRSSLGDAINKGIDVHQLVIDTMEERTGYTIERVVAKMANFGFAGGMGWKTFKKHIKSMALIDLEDEVAQSLRETWRALWPEFFDYLRDTDPAPGDGFEREDPETDRRVPLSPWDRRQAFLAGDEDFLTYLGYDGPTEWSDWDLLVGRKAVIPTGRLRQGVTYTMQRNTPFQGLAADGAKLALWNLFKQGFKLVGFVHDEIILELPADPELYALAEPQAARAMLEGMRQVIPDIRLGISIKGPLNHWGEDAQEREVFLDV